MFHQFSRRGTLAALVLAVAAPAAAQSVLADVHGLSPREVKVEAFSLGGPQDVRIEAIGEEGGSASGAFTWVRAMWNGREEGREPWTGNAWILDLQSRRVVWELSEASTSRGRPTSTRRPNSPAIWWPRRPGWG